MIPINIARWNLRVYADVNAACAEMTKDASRTTGRTTVVRKKQERAAGINKTGDDANIGRIVSTHEEVICCSHRVVR